MTTHVSHQRVLQAHELSSQPWKRHLAQTVHGALERIDRAVYKRVDVMQRASRALDALEGVAATYRERTQALETPTYRSHMQELIDTRTRTAAQRIQERMYGAVRRAMREQLALTDAPLMRGIVIDDESPELTLRALRGVSAGRGDDAAAHASALDTLHAHHARMVASELERWRVYLSDRMRDAGTL